MTKLYICAALGASLAAAGFLSYINEKSYTVYRVNDGDTLRASTEEEALRVRLACIDAPELKQAGGQEARRALEDLTLNKSVSLNIVDTDFFGRTVAEVYVGNTNVNEHLLAKGHAHVYDKFLGKCSENKDRYLLATEVAKKRQLGVWKEENPVKPWEWRRGR